MIPWFLKRIVGSASELDHKCVGQVLSKRYGLKPSYRKIDRVAMAARTAFRIQARSPFDAQKYSKTLAALRKEVINAGSSVWEASSIVFVLIAHLERSEMKAES